MRISVAMATWNGERFLAEQLESIARQSRLPDELVVYDDASTDGTVEITESFARRAPFEVVVRRNEDRVGSAETFFQAIPRCTGDLIALCDQDDIWHPDKLARCARPFETSAQVSLVAHSARAFDAARRSPNARRARIWGVSGKRHIRRPHLFQPGALPPFSGLRGFTLMLRSVVSQLIGQDRPPVYFSINGTAIPHDVWANLVCGAIGAVVLLPDNLALYRRHEMNTTRVERTTWADLARDLIGLGDEEAHAHALSAKAGDSARYLATLTQFAVQLGHPACLGLERAIHSHRCVAEALHRRACAYAERMPARASTIARHALQGDYAPRNKGGLGVTCLARDLALGVAYRPEADGRWRRPRWRASRSPVR